jgi:hypothetical protein
MGIFQYDKKTSDRERQEINEQNMLAEELVENDVIIDEQNALDVDEIDEEDAKNADEEITEEMFNFDEYYNGENSRDDDYEEGEFPEDSFT